MPEINFVGTLSGHLGETAGGNYRPVFARWEIEFNHDSFQIVEGGSSGSTFISVNNNNGMAIWNQKIDVKFSCIACHNWPKLYVEVQFLDTFNQVEISGYGFAFFPTTPGSHDINIHLFRPHGTWLQNFSASFIGGYPRYEEPVVSVTRGKHPENHLTVSTGIVLANLSVILKGFEKNVIISSK